MKSHSNLLLAMVVLWIGSAAEAKYSGGTGAPNDPYRIATPEDLNDIGNHQEDWNKHFVLVNDVNLAQYTGTQFNRIGTDWENAFTGVFNGNDHKVWNFTWSSIGRDYIGLFGYVESCGQIKNLGMENVDVNAVNGDFVGGLAGFNGWCSTITNCYSAGSVSGRGWVGGLAGGNYEEGTISKCYSSGNVSGSWCVGGLVGSNLCTQSIINCYSSCIVSGTDYVGGLAGEIWYGTITNCYSTGSATGNVHVGGLVGYSENAVVTASFWNIETSGCNTSAGGTGLPTAQMQKRSTFVDAGWDFIETWDIGEYQTYPYLRFVPAGDLNYDKKVNLVDLAILASHWLEGPL